MTTVAIIQARMTSSRLPGKVLLPLGIGTVLDSVVARVKVASGIHKIVIAIPEGLDHDPIAESFGDRSDVILIRGSETNVLSRFIIAARATAADIIVRVTSDCPLIDPQVISMVIGARNQAGTSFAATAMETGYPTGMDVEVMTREALEAAASEASDLYELEHVTPYIWRRPDRFPAIYIDRKPNLRSLRLVLDTPQDYELVKSIFERLGSKPLFDLKSILALREREPHIFEINRDVAQRPYEN
jgi:spore coat polysaccharide biosynthesis protein SpsF